MSHERVPSRNAAAADGGSAHLAQRVAELERLVAQLDRSGRRWRRALGAAVGLVVAGAILAAGAGAPGDIADVVRARRFELVGPNDRVTGLLTNTSDGGQLDLWNGAGSNAVRLSGTGRGGDISIWNGAGVPALGLFADESGGRTEAYDNTGEMMARLVAAREGGSFELYGRANQLVVAGRATENGGSLVACDLRGRPMVESAVHADGGRIDVRAKEGARVGLLAAGPRGGELRLADTAGAPALAAGADIGGGSLVVSDPKGVNLASIGPAAPESDAAQGGALVVHNALGKSVVAALAGPDGGGRFVTSTPDGTPAIVAQGGASGGLLGLLFGGERVLFLEANQGGGRTEWSGPGGQSVAAIGADLATKTGIVSLRNEKGQESVRVGVDEKGSGALTVYNRGGAERKSFSIR